MNNSHQKAILYFIIFLIAVLPNFRNPPDAGATGDAFRYTKHGGGTVDGIPYSGVDRTVNYDDYMLYYNENPEAGKYNPGECVHCHEPHASFGEAEPPPDTGGDTGADTYLLMKEYGTAANYANLCWYCHEKINFNPVLGGGTGIWGFYQGKDVYENSSHYSSLSFSWPGDGSPSPIWPRRSRAFLESGNKGSCLNCHTPHGIKASGAGTAYDTTSVDGSGGVPASRQTVASNPSVSTDYLIPRQLIAWEETLCERCHDASGPAASNIQTEINKRQSYSGHPVDAAGSFPDENLAGRHVVNEEVPITYTSVPGDKKHVECYDCHNPHAVKADTAVLGDGDGGRVKGVKYVDIDGATQDPAEGARQPYIYEVCFKCHGDSYNDFFAATDNPFPDVVQDRWGNEGHFSNKRKEFDPNSQQKYRPDGAGTFGYNTAYHPVAAPGLNGTMALCNQLKTAFGLSCSNPAAELSNLTMQCTDCHNNEQTGTATSRGPVTESNLRTTDKNSNYIGSPQPVGPHGSTENRLLRGNYVTTAGTATGNKSVDFELCFLCHAESAILGSDTNFGGTGGEFGGWNANLHMYHLSQHTWGGDIPDAVICHECHHNVHSNVEAQNTMYGDGAGGALPADAVDGISDGKRSTHLINFAPNVGATGSAYPRWFYDGSNYRCWVTCHGENMTQCWYNSGGSGQDTSWCAGTGNDW